MQLTDKEIAETFDAYDLDGRGEMSPDAFIQMMSHRQTNPEHEMQEVLIHWGGGGCGCAPPVHVIDVYLQCN